MRTQCTAPAAVVAGKCASFGRPSVQPWDTASARGTALQSPCLSEPRPRAFQSSKPVRFGAARVSEKCQPYPYELPISTPVTNTSTPPSPTWRAAATTELSM